MRTKLSRCFSYTREFDNNNGLNRSLNLRVTAMSILVIIFIMQLIFMKSGTMDHFDTHFDQWTYGLRKPLLNHIMIFITNMGSAPVIIGFIAILLALPKTRVHYGVPTMVTSLISVIIYKVLKVCIERPRPDASLRLVEAAGYSFPSGHSMNSVIFYGMVLTLIIKNCNNGRIRNVAKVVIPLLLFLIGFSRVYLACHYVTDVMAGWTFGIAIVLAVSIYTDELNRNRLSQ